MEFGSRLYGTAIQGKSDLDIKGIFLPDQSDVLLGKAPRHLRFSTGPEHDRNKPGDVDIDLWGLDKWLLTLLPQGDIGAIDLLFSPSNAACALFCDPFMERIFNNPLEFINLRGQKSYADYALRQAKKYGIRGSNLGAARKIAQWLDNHAWQHDARLGQYLDEILASCADGRYCKEVVCQHERALGLCGKIHPASTRMEEFAKRVKTFYTSYGARAEAAMLGAGVDWKALSHAARALSQIISLARDGAIRFPLQNAEELIMIKQGTYSWPKVEAIIIEKLAEAEQACQNSPYAREYRLDLAENIVLEAYARLGRAKGAY